MTLNFTTLRAMYRDRSDSLRVLRAATRHGLRVFTATATGVVLLLVYWNTLLGDIQLRYGDPAVGFLQPTPVVSAVTYFLPLVVALAVARSLARRYGRSSHLATVVVGCAAPLVVAGANVSNTDPIWVVAPVIYVLLVALILPPVSLAAWVLDATQRPHAVQEADSEVA